MKHTTTISIEIEVDIEVEYTPGAPDVMYERNGDPGHPGEPAEWELLSAHSPGLVPENVKDVTKRAIEREKLYYMILEYVEEELRDAEAEQEDARNDAKDEELSFEKRS